VEGLHKIFVQVMCPHTKRNRKLHTS